MKKNVLLIILIATVAVSCQNRFVTNTYESRKFEHKQVAVIPLESVYTGKMPENITKEDIRKIEDAESLRFQDLVHSRLIFKAGTRRNEIALDFISPSIINSKLEKANISTREAATMDPIELAKILEVDVIARGNVTMNRFISDLQSLKIDAVETVAKQVIAALGGPLYFPRTGTLSRTYRIESSLELLDAKDGAVLWKTALLRNADWSYKPEDAVASMATQHASYFPYRNKEFK
ncbi:MAG: hypothetical protein COA58_01870 [Bacteroidetes bacterium]|nr:MAG: hypothetical protein COA58_01870 [Bacteroidota bacterium]